MGSNPMDCASPIRSHFALAAIIVDSLGFALFSALQHNSYVPVPQIRDPGAVLPCMFWQSPNGMHSRTRHITSFVIFESDKLFRQLPIKEVAHRVGRGNYLGSSFEDGKMRSGLGIIHSGRNTLECFSATILCSMRSLNGTRTSVYDKVFGVQQMNTSTTATAFQKLFGPFPVCWDMHYAADG
jgi:hypothetical protein